MASAVAADGRSVTSKISASSASSQVRTGVPRKTSQWVHSARHASRDSASVSPAFPTPSTSSGTPLACSSRVT